MGGTVCNKVYMVGNFYQKCLHGLSSWPVKFFSSTNETIFSFHLKKDSFNSLLLWIFISFLFILVKKVGIECSTFSDCLHLYKTIKTIFISKRFHFITSNYFFTIYRGESPFSFFLLLLFMVFLDKTFVKDQL